MVLRRPALLVLVGVLPAARVLDAQSIFVTITGDVADIGGAQTVSDLPGPDGKVSMREAALAASNTAGPQTIGFHVPVAEWGLGTTGPVILNAGVSFAIDDDETTVDGTTQTAFTGDTNPDGAEVSFHSTTTDVVLIQSGIFAVASDKNRFVGLGDMTGRNYGIDILPQSSGNVVTGCTIRAVFAAVRVRGDGNTIGGAAPGEGNLLDSLADGLRIQGLGADPAEDNVVLGNRLTGDFNGVQIVGNATKNRIGGFAPGEANVIAGAGYLQEDGTPDGAMVRIESDGNFVLGNRIGTDPTGTAPADNVGDVGVEIYGDDNEVRGNVIGGITGLAGFLSVQAGVHLREGAERNRIVGNFIGTDVTGTIPVGNRIGVQISAFDVSLAPPGDNRVEENTIAFNEEGGVVVLLDTAGNHVSRNELRDNHGLLGLGIDLGGDGSTPNDPGDLDTGPNELMNFPVIATAVGGAQGTVVTGRLDTQAPVTALVELFSNPAPAPGELVEAHAFLGTASPNALGRFAVLLPGDATGLALSATATSALGSTSEIGAPAGVSPTPWTDLGFGLPGTHGVPVLAGGGTLAPGSELALVLADALAQAPGILVLGAKATPTTLLGATLVPAPHVLVPFATDASGAAFLIATAPLVPAGTRLFAQVGILDPSAPADLAASNAVVGMTP